jgi:hypothetical protein
VFRAIKTPGVGEAMIADFFGGLPAEYREPYPSEASYVPLLR